MLDGRKRFIVASAMFVAVGSVGLHAATPAAADPNIDSAKQRVERLYNQAEKASERYNAARDQLGESQLRLTALSSDVARQQRVVAKMRKDVAALVVDQYQGHSLSTASQLMFSDSPQSFVDNLNAATSYDSQRGQVMKEYDVQLKRLTLRKAAADDQVAALGKTQKILLTEKKKINEKAAAAKKVLSTLQDKQRRALSASAAPSSVSTLPDVPASGRAGAAVKFALSKVGEQYVFGAAGPSAWDCSGLTMLAWAQAGVGLPHSSVAQMGSGRRVSESELQPGDLVFYYSPVHHVGIYIGNGMLVHAANPGAGVEVSPVSSMPYSGAVRPG
ncbi:MAG: NlpC/P60 family protein [Marmoricola sp.]